MAVNLLKPYFRISEAVGINIVIGIDGSIEASLCRLKASGNKLEIAQRKTGIRTLAELQKVLPKKSLVALNLAGKGVLVKQTEKLEDINVNTFSAVLPNARPEDFYVQNFVSGERSFVSLVRKTEADKWITELEGMEAAVLALSLGPFAVEQVLPQLNFYDQQVLFDGHRIERDEQKAWTAYRYLAGSGAAFPIKVETEKLDEVLVIPYAAAFQLVLSTSLLLIQAEVPSLEAKLKAALADKKVLVYSGASLGLLFVLLLVNFLLFSHYNAANAVLTERVGRTSHSVTDVEALNARVKAKEALLDTLGWDDGRSKSVLMDQVAQLLPPEVTWQEAAVDPVSMLGDAQRKHIEFMDRMIKIGGSTQKIVLVNEWISRLRSLPWVKNAQLQSYTYNNEQNTGQFMVMISY